MRNSLIALMLASACGLGSAGCVMAQTYGSSSSSTLNPTAANTQTATDWSGRAEEPNLRPGYPSTNNTVLSTQATNAQTTGQAVNTTSSQAGKIHLVRAVKHIVGFSLKAPFSLVP